jgi:superfamily II DNA or RNA helicase
MPEPRFKKGEIVCQVNQPERVGTVMTHDWSAAVETFMYVVLFGTARTRVPETALAPAGTGSTPWEQLADGTCAGVGQFRIALTYHRLRRPPSRIAHSFASARTQFFPHQFKPLLKFLDRPERRLLVADDVGLGKTIEAGYILRELRAREPAAMNRILILVPARLTSKWKKEMEDRFDEHFEVVRKSHVLQALDRVERGRELEPFRWIASYESLRDAGVLDKLRRVPLELHLLIADEAHRMRNVGAQQYRLGSLLTASADAAVFLSATPVQNSREDLWNLLRMLSPEEFGEWSFFQQQLQANRPILQALSALSLREPDWSESQWRLEEFFKSPPGRVVASEVRKAILDTIAEQPTSRRALVELQADVSRLSPTGHIITRTRKVEVMAQRALRVPKWHSVSLSEAESYIYKEVQGLCQLVTGSPVSEWGLLMLYRMTASCIPAAMVYFRERLESSGRGDLLEELEEQPRDQEVSPPSELPWTSSAREPLEKVLAQWSRAPLADSKLDALLDVLQGCWREDKAQGGSRRKVVLFSFFRRTLDYLYRELSARGIQARVIHGGYAIEERERAIEEFLERKEVDLLLTSDVGGEGIDLQRASILINYDLPWNPMVVEQRIGRVDRIGQQSERILIVNLVVEGSVEQRILQRLLTKIQVFVDSIGELDGIIGDELETITSGVLSGRIPEGELEHRLHEREAAMERVVGEARSLRSRVDDLLAADQGLLDEIEAVTGERQIPTNEELLNFVNGTLAQAFTGSQLPAETISRVLMVDLRGPLWVVLERWSLQAGEGPQLFARRINSGPVKLTLSREAAMVHRDAELIHLNHPLVRFCLDRRQKEVQTSVAYALRLAHSEVLPPGLYAFSLHFVETQSARLRMRVQGVFAQVGGERTWTEAEDTRRVLLEILDRAEDIAPPAISRQATEQIERRLGIALDGVIRDLQVLERRLELQRRSQYRANQRAQAEHRVQREQARLQQLQQSNASDFPLRMAHFRLQKAEEALKLVAGQEPGAEGVFVMPEEVAVGILTVGGA